MGMRFCALAVGMVVALTTNAFAQEQGAREHRESYGLFQVGATTGVEAGADHPLLTVGATFGQRINQLLDIYAMGGWQEEAPPGGRDTLQLTSGLKLMLWRNNVVRPYVVAGAGVMHFRMPEFFHGENRFLTEVGAGVAFPVGAAGYIDVGYRYFKPYHGATDFTPNGVFAGFGIRY